MMLKIHYSSYIMIWYLSKLRRLCAFPNTINTFFEGKNQL